MPDPEPLLTGLARPPVPDSESRGPVPDAETLGLGVRYRTPRHFHWENWRVNGIGNGSEIRPQIGSRKIPALYMLMGDKSDFTWIVFSTLLIVECDTSFQTPLIMPGTDWHW